MADTVETLTARLVVLDAAVAEAEIVGPSMGLSTGITTTRQPYALLCAERDRVRLRLARLTRIAAAGA